MRVESMYSFLVFIFLSCHNKVLHVQLIMFVPFLFFLFHVILTSSPALPSWRGSVFCNHRDFSTRGIRVLGYLDCGGVD